MIPHRVVNGVEYGAITLGTVQLGLEYGICNRTGLPSEAGAARILDVAEQAGIALLDTARAYGQSEARIGALDPAGTRFKVCTKLELPKPQTGDSERTAIDAVDRSVEASLRALGRTRLDIVLFHEMDAYLGWNGAAATRLAELSRQGIIGAIGVSVYTPDEALRCLNDARIHHIQIPFNILDQRWTPSVSSAVELRGDVAVHARSVFLQGLLVGPPEVWPAWFSNAGDVVRRLGGLAHTFGRRNAADLCIAYVMACRWIASLVIGCETAEQLAEIAEFARLPPLEPDQVQAVNAAFLAIEPRLLNPSLW